MTLFPTFTHLSVCVIYDCGKLRDHNQDNYYLNGLYTSKLDSMEATREKQIQWTELPALLAVADGMGGEQYGEEAAFTAVKTLRDTGKEQDKASFIEVLKECNRRVCALREARGGIMCGTTFAGICFRRNKALIANVGDSRIYLFRRNRLKLLTHDDTRAQMFVDAGLLNPREAAIHPDRNVLTQHLGLFPSEREIRPHFKELRIKQGDLFLLCSDGLYSMVKDSRIHELLSMPGNIESKATALFSAAMDEGGADNITILLAEVNA